MEDLFRKHEDELYVIISKKLLDELGFNTDELLDTLRLLIKETKKGKKEKRKESKEKRKKDKKYKKEKGKKEKRPATKNSQRKQFLELFPKVWQDERVFRKALKDFCQHRKELKRKLTPLSMKRLANKLTKYDMETAISALNSSVENSWTGVFPSKVIQSSNKPATLDFLKQIFSNSDSLDLNDAPSVHAFIEFCYEPALQLLSNKSTGSRILAQKLVNLSNWYMENKKKPSIRELREMRNSDKPHIRRRASRWDRTPGSVKLIREYVKWLSANSYWIDSCTPKTFEPTSTLFSKFLTEYQRNLGVDIISGRPFSRT